MKKDCLQVYEKGLYQMYFPMKWVKHIGNKDVKFTQKKLLKSLKFTKKNLYCRCSTPIFPKFLIIFVEQFAEDLRLISLLFFYTP